VSASFGWATRAPPLRVESRGSTPLALFGLITTGHGDEPNLFATHVAQQRGERPSVDDRHATPVGLLHYQHSILGDRIHGATIHTAYGGILRAPSNPVILREWRRAGTGDPYQVRKGTPGAPRHAASGWEAGHERRSDEGFSDEPEPDPARLAPVLHLDEPVSGHDVAHGRNLFTLARGTW
jgi:hypothetical protein